MQAELDQRRLLVPKPLASAPVDFGDGLDLPEAVAAQLTLLDWIGNQAGLEPDTFVGLAALFKGQPQDHQQGLAADLRDLRDRGWLLLDEATGYDGWTCRLTTGGVDAAEDLRRRRGDSWAGAGLRGMPCCAGSTG